MPNLTYYYQGAVGNLQNSQGLNFFVHGVFILMLLTCLVMACLWYDSRDEMEDGNKEFNPIKFSKKVRNICCFPEACQAAIARGCIVMGVVGNSYLEVLQEEEAMRETRTLERLMEARRLEKEQKKRRRSKKSSRRSHGGGNSSDAYSDDGDSTHSGHGLL